MHFYIKCICTCTYVCICVCVCVRAGLCACMRYVRICMHKCRGVDVHVHMCRCVYACMYLCIYMFMGVHGVPVKVQLPVYGHVHM